MAPWSEARSSPNHLGSSFLARCPRVSRSTLERPSAPDRNTTDRPAGGVRPNRQNSIGGLEDYRSPGSQSGARGPDPTCAALRVLLQPSEGISRREPRNLVGPPGSAPVAPPPGPDPQSWNRGRSGRYGDSHPRRSRESLANSPIRNFPRPGRSRHPASSGYPRFSRHTGRRSNAYSASTGWVVSGFTGPWPVGRPTTGATSTCWWNGWGADGGTAPRASHPIWRGFSTGEFRSARGEKSTGRSATGFYRKQSSSGGLEDRGRRAGD